jgi:hypothetical protein
MASNRTPNDPTRTFFKLEALETRDTPTVIASNDNYAGNRGGVLTVPATTGLLSNDFTDNLLGVLASFTDTAPYYADVNGNALPLQPTIPQANLLILPNGGFQLLIPSNDNGQNNQYIAFKYRVTDTKSANQAIDTDYGTVIVTINEAGRQKFYATGAGVGSPSSVRVYESGTGLLKFEFDAYPGFTGGVRVATGDLTGDGIDDIATIPASGGGPRVRVFDGQFGIQLEDFLAVDANFRGGGYIAIGDINGTQNFVNGNKVGTIATRNDLIVGAGEGGGPRVTIYDGSKINTIPLGTGGPSTFSTSVIGDYFAYGANSRAGVQVATGNTTGDLSLNRRDYIITAPGAGGGPQVRVFDGRKVNGGFTAFPPSEFSFFAFNPNSRAGVNIAVGRFRGGTDSAADIVVGTGDGSPVVRVFDGRSGAQLREFVVPAADGPTGSIPNTVNFTNVSNFSNTSTGGGLVTTNGRNTQRGGARVAVVDRNSDGRSDIVAAIGPGSAPRVRIFDGVTFTELDNFVAYSSSFLGGVYVGGNSLGTT